MFLAFRNLPIKRKLMVVILLTSSFALLLMGTALILYERRTYRHNVAVNMSVLAQIIGSNNTAALAFDDAKNAREILIALLAEKQITAAAIYDQNEKIFASFPDHVEHDSFPAHPGPDGQKFDRNHFFMFQPILQKGTRLGTIYLQADLSGMYARSRVYGLILLLVGVLSTLAAMALAARLQRRIAGPILELAKVATAVSEQHDYSVRGTKYGQDEVGQLTDAFNQMLAYIGESNAALAASEEELRRANKEKDNFLAILSHELRTPLTPVLATVAMLRDDETVPKNMQADLEMIRRNIELEARLIDDLLDINRIVRGKLDLNRQVVDVRKLLDHAIKNYCLVAAEKKNIKTSIEITASETHVLVDSSRLTQVFWNVLQNACKFTPANGAITVRVYNECRQIASSAAAPASDEQPPPIDVLVQITDTGMGISADTLPRIFNAFEQGARSRDAAFGGLGLGLSISRAIMELHDGTITAASQGKDEGTTFTVRLHTVKPVATEPAENLPTYDPDRVVTSLRVLVVEDHIDTAEQFARLLKRAGHEVICASNIAEAQECAVATPDKERACAFDILISDVDLPDGSGRDLMRNLGRRYPIRGIAISGHGMKEDIESSIAAGFSYHITKPVNWEELKAAILKISFEILQSEEQPLG